MELTQLRYFKAVAECGTMNAAAQKMNVSQPALSAAIKKLEDELGVRLFERQKNKLALNDAGKIALTYASLVIDKADEMKNAFRQYIDQYSGLSLGFCDPGPLRLSVPRFQKVYPDIDVFSEIVEQSANIEDCLLSRKYDAVVSLQKIEKEGVVSVPFANEELMLSVPSGHRLAQRKTVCLHQEQGEHIFVYTLNGAFEHKIAGFIAWVFSLPAVKVFNDYFVFRQSLATQNALCFTTRLVQNYRHDGDGRVIIPLADEGVKATYWLSFLRTNKKKVQPLLAWCQENMLMLLGDKNLTL